MAFPRFHTPERFEWTCAVYRSMLVRGGLAITHACSKIPGPKDRIDPAAGHVVYTILPDRYFRPEDDPGSDPKLFPAKTWASPSSFLASSTSVCTLYGQAGAGRGSLNVYVLGSALRSPLEPCAARNAVLSPSLAFAMQKALTQNKQGLFAIQTKAV